jgi:formyltetrahydrofolate-dependent phosphoribosylglycinamide formyltransferase
VLLLGSGGREHAIAHKMSQSLAVALIFVAPGNGGTALSSKKVENVELNISDMAAIQSFVVDSEIDLVVVGPEQPLVDGVVNLMNAINIPCFGPSAEASVIEASKAWSKDFMARHAIRTAAYGNFQDIDAAKEYVHKHRDRRLVVKASGLAAGKGVIIPADEQEAIAAVDTIMNEKAFGGAGNEVVIEEFIEGEEVSLLAFTDGMTVVGMPAAQDHKRVGDNDQGLNTGGMGAYAPAPVLTPYLRRKCMEVMQRAVDGMRAEGKLYQGVLYGGFMIPADPSEEPVVLEFNCRFGDPETQVLLPLLDSDLYAICLACARGFLHEVEVRWKKDSFACTVVCAADGYPEAYRKGDVIDGVNRSNDQQLSSSVTVYHAGTMKKQDGGSIVTNGGRVLAVTGVGSSLQGAVQEAYLALNNIHFQGMHFRKDIARRGIKAPLRIGVLGSTRGSSLQAVIDAIIGSQGKLRGAAKISIVISNKSDAMILQRATLHKIRSLYLPCTKGTDRATYDRQVTAALEDEGVELVLLVGYMRIVSADFVQRWQGRCINVHPSLLPDFAGGMDLQVHEAVIAAKKTMSGCSVHLVTEQVDGGPIIVQPTCPVLPNDTAEALKQRVQALEGPAFIEAIQLYLRSNHSFPTIASSITYKDAGVDIDAGDNLIHHIKPFCKATRRSGCDAELGGFGGLFDLQQAGYDSNETILVSGTDGVGTKLKIAQSIGKHDTIGIDLVAMCVNDVLVCGAEPLFFLDYYATGHLDVQEAALVVKGIAAGCELAGCALIGGETAEMAGMYAAGEYDLAGFSVGAVRRSELLPRMIGHGDVLIGLRSSGVHSNGYSLVRRCVQVSGMVWTDPAPFTKEVSLGEALLTPTRIYVKLLLPMIRKGLIKGMAHITGGGLLENLPRVLPDHVDAVVDVAACGWTLPPVFRWLQSIAKLPQEELLRTFNCGIGMVLVIDRNQLDEVVAMLRDAKEEDFMMLGSLRSRDPAATAIGAAAAAKVVMLGEVI